MAKIDAKKETISFLTKLFFVIIGVSIIILGGLISMFQNQNTNIIFWFGVLSVLSLSLGCLLVFKHIQKNIKEIEKL